MLDITMARVLRGSAARSEAEMGVFRYLARHRGWLKAASYLRQ